MVESTSGLPVKTEAAAVAPPAEGRLFRDLRREIDRLFDDFNPFAWRGRSRLAADTEAQHMGSLEWAITPAIDVAESAAAYELTAELPGIDDKDIEIRLGNGTLTIKGEKSQGSEQNGKDYYLSERRYGSFQRSFRVPESVDTGRIEASFAKGVLKVVLPKTADAQQADKKIEVKAA